MKQIIPLILGLLLSACAVKMPVQYKYKLEDFGVVKYKGKQDTASLFVSTPLAASGYQTEEMLYVIKPYELNAFAKNAWVGAPARMLSPLILQSLQASHFFYAITSIPYADKTNYRLDTKLLSFQQNFMMKPSVLEMVVKNVITNTQKNQVVASKIFIYHIPCPIEAPYGGVLAANMATKQYTADLTKFVTQVIRHDSH